MENLAIYIWQTIKRDMNAPELLYEVRLTDDESNSVVYNGCEKYNKTKGQTFLTSDTY